MAAVRAVTVPGGPRVVPTVDQLADFAGAPLSSLDIGLRNGPVRAGLLERLIQGTHIGYRHPDGPAEREAARLTASTVAAPAGGPGFAG
jgi:hypothetical protein